MPEREAKPIIQLEIRPGFRGTPELRRLAEALLAAASEEMDREDEARRAGETSEVQR